MAEQESSTSENPKEQDEGTAYGGWRDSFRWSWERVDRAPLSEFRIVLEELSPGLSALELGSLEKLAKVSFVLERLGDEVSALPLYERMLDILIAAQTELAAHVPDFLPNFVWVFTWVKVGLLHHAMFQPRISTEQMDATSQWWTFLYCLWPDDGSCKRTKQSLDIHRRMALIECGHETEAVAGFQSFQRPWMGFETAFLLYLVTVKHYKTSRYEKAVECILRAETSVPATHERTPYIMLFILFWKALTLQSAHIVKEADDTKRRFLRCATSVDLQTVVGEDPEFGALKVGLQGVEQFFMRNLSDHEKEVELVTEPARVSDKLEPYDQLAALLRRAEQLSGQGRYADALRELQICLADVEQKKAILQVRELVHLDFPWRSLMLHVLAKLSANDGVDRRKERRAIAKEGMRFYLEQIEDLQWWKYPDLDFRMLLSQNSEYFAYQQYWLSATRFLSTLGYSEDESRAAEYDEAKREYWESWEDCCSTLRIYAQGVAQRQRNTSGPTDYSRTAYSATYISYYLIHEFHIRCVGDARVWPHPRPSEEYRSSYTHGLARRALLCSERARACSVLLQEESQPKMLKDERAYEQALETSEWDIIREIQGICGPGTIFLEYNGWPNSKSVCVVDGDGTVSTHWLDRLWLSIDATMVQDMITAVLSAINMSVKGKGQTGDEMAVNNHLENLYELLMKPLLPTLKEPMKPQHKLIIVATGSFANVPFTILRNRATGRYLFQDVTVSVTPSLRLLNACNKRYVDLQKRPLYPGEGAAVAVGNPAYKFPVVRLPESEKEVTAISNLFNMPSGAYKVAKLLNEEATVEDLLEWVRKATTRYSQGFVHIAAHAEVDDRKYARGALLLTAARGSGSRSISAAGERDAPHVLAEKPANGVTAAEEALKTPPWRSIAEAAESEAESVRAGQTLKSLNSYLPSQHISTSDIEWSAYMAVLSACKTSTGQEVEAGTLNLGRAFITAGVPCTVLSLWPVQDGSTSHLMQLFYKQLKHGEDASTALRSAMLIMLDEGGYGLHQFAPFVVSGLPTVRLPPQLRAIE